MGRYRTINVDLNRQYRNDLNKNFEDIEKDIFGTESDIARIEAESKERDNLIAGTDVEAILERIDSSATNAELQSVYARNQGDYAKTQGGYAKSQGDYAKSKGDYANEKAILADQAAATANTESSNLSQLKVNVTTATQNANTATSNANTARTNANNAATHATTQGDYAKREADRIAGMDVSSLNTRMNELQTALNNKANKAQGSWNTVTLQNGWSGTVRYKINDLGIVNLTFNAYGGVVSKHTTICNIPVGFRPNINLIVGLITDTANIIPNGLYIEAGGNVKLGTDLAAGVYHLGGVTFNI